MNMFYKVILPRNPFPTNTLKNLSRFFLLESCFFKQESRFYPLDRYCPTIVVYLPLNCGEVSAQLWCAFPTIVGKYKIQRKTKC